MAKCLWNAQGGATKIYNMAAVECWSAHPVELWSACNRASYDYPQVQVAR